MDPPTTIQVSKLVLKDAAEDDKILDMFGGYGVPEVVETWRVLQGSIMRLPGQDGA